MKLSVFFLAIVLLWPGGPVTARDWFRPAHAGKKYINSDLTPARALAAPPKNRWNGQLVLWDGTVTEHILREGKHEVKLATTHGVVQVHFPNEALNLEYDRTGYRVAVKGELRVKDQQIQGLTGRSVILLSPPRPWQLKTPPTDSPVAQDRLYPFLCWWLQFHNPEAPEDQTATIASAILEESYRNGIDPLFLASLLQVESAFDVDAVSVSGAIGLGQLMPFTAEGLGVDAYDPSENVAGAARMISNLLTEWEHTGNARASALASYNAGPNHVRNLGGGIPRFSQTTNYVYFIGYVHKVMTRLAREQGALTTSRL